jgi:hypothetical protein
MTVGAMSDVMTMARPTSIKAENPLRGTETWTSTRWCWWELLGIKAENPLRGTETNLTSCGRGLPHPGIKAENPLRGTETTVYTPIPPRTQAAMTAIVSKQRIPFGGLKPARGQNAHARV